MKSKTEPSVMAINEPGIESLILLLRTKSEGLIKLHGLTWTERTGPSEDERLLRLRVDEEVNALFEVFRKIGWMCR